MLTNTLIGPDMGRMVVESPRVTAASRPGNFVMLRTWEGEPLLPRAMAPLRYNAGMGCMEIYYRIKGPGTQAMARSVKGAAARLTGPLGTPVTKSFQGKTVALVGRGVGITPLLPLAEHIIAAGGSVRCYLSARIHDYLFGYQRFSELGSVHSRVDEDGHGDSLVTELLEEEVEDVNAIYVCGSRRLVHHAHEVGSTHGLPTYVFLEEKMGCGTGFCKGCPVTLSDGTGYRLVCTDGPVFDTKQIVLT